MNEFLLLTGISGNKFIVRKSVIKDVCVVASEKYSVVCCLNGGEYSTTDTPEEIYYMLEGNGLIRVHTTGVEQVRDYMTGIDQSKFKTTGVESKSELP